MAAILDFDNTVYIENQLCKQSCYPGMILNPKSAINYAYIRNNHKLNDVKMVMAAIFYLTL